jgi:Ribonuclease G/E
MVLESNRDLVLRRLMECLGRDRTRHNVAEVTSLGLVQMTRKRVGTGLLESFSETCTTCGGSGVVLTIDPVAARRPAKPPKPAPSRNRPILTDEIAVDEVLVVPEAVVSAPRKRRPRKTTATQETTTESATESATDPALDGVPVDA